MFLFNNFLEVLHDLVDLSVENHVDLSEVNISGSRAAFTWVQFEGVVLLGILNFLYILGPKLRQFGGNSAFDLS